MCEPRKNLDCNETLVEIGLVVLFVILATTASIIVVPGLM